MYSTSSKDIISVEERTVRSALVLWMQPCFSLILPVSALLTFHLSLSLSISQIPTLCKSVGWHQLSSVWLTCAIMGGILWGSRLHITLLPHVRQERVVCTHTKVLVIFIVCCWLCKWCFLLFWCELFFSVAWCLSVCLSVCVSVHPPQIQPHDDFAFLFCQWLPFDWGGRLGCLVMAT